MKVIWNQFVLSYNHWVLRSPTYQFFSIWEKRHFSVFSYREWQLHTQISDFCVLIKEKFCNALFFFPVYIYILPSLFLSSNRKVALTFELTKFPKAAAFLWFLSANAFFDKICLSRFTLSLPNFLQHHAPYLAHN